MEEVKNPQNEHPDVAEEETQPQKYQRVTRFWSESTDELQVEHSKEEKPDEMEKEEENPKDDECTSDVIFPVHENEPQKEETPEENVRYEEDPAIEKVEEDKLKNEKSMEEEGDAEAALSISDEVYGEIGQKFSNSRHDIESGKQNAIKDDDEGKVIFWTPIVVSIFIIIAIGVIALCLINWNTYDTENNGPYTTHKYRFPETNFDDCCVEPENKRAYLEACSQLFKNDKIKCTNVIRGSAIITTESTNPKHEKIILNTFSKLKHIHNHSALNGHYYGEKEEKERNKKTEDDEKNDNLTSSVSSLQRKIEKKDEQITNDTAEITQLRKLNETFESEKTAQTKDLDDLRNKTKTVEDELERTKSDATAEKNELQELYKVQENETAQKN